MSTDIIGAIASKALDGLYARQAATAQNVANAGAENYVPVRVTFENELREAWMASRGGDQQQAMARIDSLQPGLVQGFNPGDESVRIDQEVATASETTARYAMLTSMLDRTIQLKQLVIKGG